MSKTSGDYFECHMAAEERLQAVIGLSTVLQAVAVDFPGLNNPDPTAHGILTVIRTMSRELQALQTMHEAEWTAHYAQVLVPPKA